MLEEIYQYGPYINDTPNTNQKMLNNDIPSWLSTSLLYLLHSRPHRHSQAVVNVQKKTLALLQVNSSKNSNWVSRALAI